MIGFKTIYQFTFYVIFFIVFLIGGMLQFFFGFPNTLMMIGICLIMFINYCFYVLIHRRVVFNRVVFFAITYLFLILLSGLINKSHIINILVYTIFPLLPLSVYFFFHINKNEKYIKQKTIYKLIFFIASIQLPVILIQKYSYDFLIFFNNSGQKIASFDFLFGSFLLKSDHSLGCFIVLTTLSLLFNINNIRRYINYPILFSFYLSITLLLSESNISKALLILVWMMFIIKKIYDKIRSDVLTKKIFIGLMFLFIGITLFNIRNIELITSRLGGTFEKHYTIERSYRFFEQGTAKREQIVITAMNKLDTKYIGDGPYSYFDIKTGKFKKTIHFSQIIWTYFDLGLIGLILIILYAQSLIKKGVMINNKIYFFGVVFLFSVYMFYTTPFSEIGVLLSFFLSFNFNTSNEFNNNTISRLA